MSSSHGKPNIVEYLNFVPTVGAIAGRKVQTDFAAECTEVTLAIFRAQILERYRETPEIRIVSRLFLA